MPSITSYTAPNIDLNPSERGVSAWDSTARRINAFYGDVAGYQRRQGSLAAEVAKLKMWPFDILNLYETQSKAAAGGGQANLRVRGAGSSFGGPTETFAEFGQSRNTGAPYQGVGEISAGAAALGRGLADGGYQAARAPRGGGAERGIGGDSGEDYTLLRGDLVSMKTYRQQQIEDRERIWGDANKWGLTEADTAEYWRRWNGDAGTVQQYPGSAYGPVVSEGGPQPSAAPTSETGDYSGGRDLGTSWFNW